MRRLIVVSLGCWSPALAEPDVAAPATAPAPAPASVPAEAAATAPAETLAAAPDSGSGRLGEAALEALAKETGGPCDAHRLPATITVGECSVVGPLQGLITNGVDGPETPNHADALAACAQDPKCLGISSKWYIGSPWYPVSGGTFAVDRASYGCTLVLKCPSAPTPQPKP